MYQRLFVISSQAMNLRMYAYEPEQKQQLIIWEKDIEANSCQLLRHYLSCGNNLRRNLEKVYEVALTKKLLTSDNNVMMRHLLHRPDLSPNDFCYYRTPKTNYSAGISSSFKRMRKFTDYYKKYFEKK